MKVAWVRFEKMLFIMSLTDQIQLTWAKKNRIWAAVWTLAMTVSTSTASWKFCCQTAAFCAPCGQNCITTYCVFNQTWAAIHSSLPLDQPQTRFNHKYIQKNKLSESHLTFTKRSGLRQASMINFHLHRIKDAEVDVITEIQHSDWTPRHSDNQMHSTICFFKLSVLLKSPTSAPTFRHFHWSCPMELLWVTKAKQKDQKQKEKKKTSDKNVENDSSVKPKLQQYFLLRLLTLFPCFSVFFCSTSQACSNTIWFRCGATSREDVRSSGSQWRHNNAAGRSAVDVRSVWFKYRSSCTSKIF